MLAPRKLFASVAMPVACLVFSLNPLYAQYDNGSLVGTIRDNSGAAVPGVQVSLTNTATGIITATTTNSTGDYQFPDVRIGIYNVTATSSGFSKAEADRMTVSVGVRQRIDLGLKVGGSETVVEVSGVELQVETENSERDQTITNYQSEGFPW